MKPSLNKLVVPSLALAVVAVFLGGCREPYTETGWATTRITEDYTFPARGDDGKALPEGKTWSALDLDKGRMAYMHYCYACHGVNGDGKGPAAHGFRPPPRDFRTAMYKFGSVRSGELPSDADLNRIVESGLHGTPMLDWDIQAGERERIVAFIKTFPQPPCDEAVSGKEACDKELAEFPDGKPSKWLTKYTRGKKKGQLKPIGKPITVPETDPWAGKTQEAIAKGQELYHLKAQCANCHAGYMTRQELSALSEKVEGKPMTTFRAAMYQGIVLAAKDNPYKVNLMPPDFTLNPLRSIRKGQEVHDLWRLIAAGVGGVMPAWIDGLKPDEIWALSHYIKSLTDLTKPENRAKLTALRNKLANQAPFKAPPPPPPPTKKVTVEIGADGKVKLGDAEVESDDELRQQLGKMVAAGPVEVVIKAEKAKEDRVIEIAKLVKSVVPHDKIKLPDGIELPADDDQKADAEDDAPAGDPDGVPIPGDPDALDPKGKTKVPPTPTPPVKPPSVPKPPVGKPPVGKAAPPAEEPYD